ncbi:amidase [Variovorax paradoxus]|uniref:amidase n=1 Tax=Variovorax paradoxus TaxID=34073 RepID=UPI002784B493|nr:amidase [Variovorax paradoxus]MDQ0586276.1 aspartyl-tRNA(Asn)/glutamyl-tRNA(Gln) amidotransferase subunit A [Variovorax paradoxus]
MHEDLHRQSALRIARDVRDKKLSATEVAGAFIERAERLDPLLNAFADFEPGLTLAAAQSVDARIAAGEQLPLAGVPFTVKDNLWLGGRPATFGSQVFADFVAPRDSWCVERLRALGAVPLAVTNCSEFACKGITATPLHGETRNPWDLQRTPGGSSGGAVAAVAAGLGPIALATDAGGSVRRPAAHAGLVGMKPTLGRVPNPWGFDDPNHLLSVIGQIGRNVEDVAFMLDALTAWEPADTLSSPAFSVPDAMASLREPLGLLRLAWSPQLGCGLAVDADVLATMEAAIDRLQRAGWQIERADPAWPAEANEYPLIALQQAGLAQRFGAVWRRTPERLDPDIGAQIELGFAISGTRVTELLKLREDFHASFTRFFSRFDALLCPTSPVEAWPLGSLGPSEIGGLPAGPRGHAAFTPLFNYGGVPALSLPCGTGRQGLPVGLQISGPRFADARVLQLAWHAEQILGVGPASALMG